MRKFPLISMTLFGLTLSLGVVACDGDDGDDSADEMTGDGDGDGDATGDGDGDGDDPTGDGDGDGGCFTAPPECLQLLECFAVILPGTDVSQYGADGSCWCGTEAEAQACYATCVEQLGLAVDANPTVGECHGRYCPIEDLDPTQPYGPPDSGCLDGEQVLNGLPIPGNYCAPECSGFAKSCVEHTQTIAEGTCYWGGGDNGFCALNCFVDPYVYASGTQCQCGATCQPYGGVDGSGNLRGVCTFE